MTQVIASSVSDIEALAPSWRLSLESENKPSARLMSYGYATTQFVAFLQEKGRPTDVTTEDREGDQPLPRSRRSHPDAESEWLWLGLKGRMTGSGIR